MKKLITFTLLLSVFWLQAQKVDDTPISDIESEYVVITHMPLTGSVFIDFGQYDKRTQANTYTLEDGTELKKVYSVIAILNDFKRYGYEATSIGFSGSPMGYVYLLKKN